jgi:hypothetical protein
LTHGRFGDIIDTSTTDQEIEMEDQVIAMYEDGFTVAEIAEAFNTDLEQVQDILAGYLDDEFDDSMDGDHDSALTSAGYGMDEDYGMASEMDLY